MIGLLLLTGGEGRRLGGPKHLQPHPRGGTWGGYLVEVFEAVFPEGRIRVLGAPVPERPELECFADVREGPARALADWAAWEGPGVARWWVVACDQVRWTPARLQAWNHRAEAADPAASAWVLAEHGNRVQYLGGILGGTLLDAVAASSARSLGALFDELPTRLLPESGPEWGDVDTPEDLALWEP